jgi:hypothetical protein
MVMVGRKTNDVREFLGKRPLGRPRNVWVNDINTVLRVRCCDNGRWIQPFRIVGFGITCAGPLGSANGVGYCFLLTPIGGRLACYRIRLDLNESISRMIQITEPTELRTLFKLSVSALQFKDSDIWNTILVAICLLLTFLQVSKLTQI